MPVVMNVMNKQVPVESIGSEAAAASTTLLSNELIYLPLSYFTTTERCEEDGSRKRNQIKGFKDYQVCDFFEKVSKVYTGNDSQVSWLSSRPKSSALFPAGTSAINRTAHLDGKIFARSLVLSGGVGDASNVRKNKRRIRAKKLQLSSGCTARVQSRMVGQMTKRKRKRICENAGFPMIGVSPHLSQDPHRTTPCEIKKNSINDTLSSPHQACHPLDSGSFSGRVIFQNYQSLPSLVTLHTLHSLWVSYVEKLVGPTLRTCLSGETKSGTCADKVTSHTIFNDTCSAISLILSKNLEICGALVKILSCPSQCHYNGKSGIIVDETCNTWRMVTLKARKRRKADVIDANVEFIDFKHYMVNAVSEGRETAETKGSSKTGIVGPDASSQTLKNKTKLAIHLVIIPKRNSEIEVKVTIGEYNLGIVLNGSDLSF